MASGRRLSLLQFLAAAFGVVAAAPTFAQPGTVGVTLVGLAIASGPDGASAMLRCDADGAGAHARFVRPGESVCGVSLESIDDAGVTVRVGATGKAARLPLPDHPATATPPAAPARDDVIAAAPPLAEPVVSTDAGSVHVAIDQATLDAYLSNLPGLMTAAIALPRWREGDEGQKLPSGFELSRVQPGGIVDRLGLRDGDVITSVNGAPAGDVSAVPAALASLVQAKHATVGIARGDSQLLYVVDIR